MPSGCCLSVLNTPKRRHSRWSSSTEARNRLSWKAPVCGPTPAASRGTHSSISAHSPIQSDLGCLQGHPQPLWGTCVSASLCASASLRLCVLLPKGAALGSCGRSLLHHHSGFPPQVTSLQDVCSAANSSSALTDSLLLKVQPPEGREGCLTLPQLSGPRSFNTSRTLSARDDFRPSAPRRWVFALCLINPPCTLTDLQRAQHP